jgi:hypothetical protein
MRDLSLERHSPMNEQQSQQNQLTTNNGRVRPTQPSAVPQDYYGTITNRLSPGITIGQSIFCKKIEQFHIR